jgi:hypothetical protein
MLVLGDCPAKCRRSKQPREASSHPWEQAAAGSIFSPMGWRKKVDLTCGVHLSGHVIIQSACHAYSFIRIMVGWTSHKHIYKFVDSNVHFASLETQMTPLTKSMCCTYTFYSSQNCYTRIVSF